MLRTMTCPQCGTLHTAEDDAEDGPDRPCDTCNDPSGDTLFACSLYKQTPCSMVPICDGIECPPATMAGETL